MADVTQNVIIEFISDTTKLEPAVDQLEKIGKVEQGQAAAFKATNTEINKQAEALKKVSAVNQQIDATGKITKKNVADLATAVKGMSGTFQKEFKAGVIDGLKQAGVSIKEFEKSITTSFDKAETETTSLRTQLKSLVDQLGALEIAGKTNTNQYKELAAQAVVVKKAMNDVADTIKNKASDTSALDGLIGVAQGLAGGFAVAQGAAALFGDESEELQKTLLRVNAAMAILQGLQQIQIVLQKESSAAQLASTIATKAQTAAQAAFNFVVGSSTGVLKAFRIALAATGVGLLVIGIISLVNALSDASDEAEDLTKKMDDLKDANQAALRSLNRELNENLAAAQARGESEIAQSKIELENIDKKIAKNKELKQSIIDLSKNVFNDESIKTLRDELKSINEESLDLASERKVLESNIIKQESDARDKAAKKRSDDNKQALADAKRLAEERLQKAKEARAAEFQNFKAGIELELLAAEKGSDAELAIRKRLLDAEFQIEIDNEKLTNNQRELLFQKFLKDRNDLDDQYQKDRFKKTVENIQSGIDADLAALELSFDDKLRFTETAIRLQAQVEIAAAEGNAAKIIQIEATRDKAIRDARISSIQEAVNYDIALAEATNGPGKRRLQAALENGELELEERKAIITALASLDNDAIQKRIDALNNERQQGLISQKDYNLQYAQLVDQQTQIWEDAEKKKTDATKAESQKRIDQFKEEIENVVKVAEVVGDILSGIADIQSQRENEKIAEDRARLKGLQEAGAITEKDAIRSMKKIDAEERKIKRDQAKRDKEIAIFDAVINTARGVAAALPNPFLVALAIAIGAAQIAIIASRPLPKFAKGKKGSYQGLAEVGEAGSELIEQNGRMFVADKPSIVYLGSKDKVYSHKETVEMMSKPQMSKERNGIEIKTEKGVQIDYEKLGKAVGKNVQTNVYVDGIKEQQIKKQEFIKYLDARRKF